ncbi:MAG TPA: M67 family metallopeptidase [Acidimicrobiales bacterium]|nr:M67 family metallopeptidase [Acidimicrobiales bacterium]
MLRLTNDVYQRMVGHCYDGLPLEACGLLGGDPAAGEDTAQASLCYPTGNDAASARVYTVNPRDHLRADRDAEAHGLQIIGVFHSHTHTEAYPSPTDVAQAPDPTWHYVLVSLKDGAAVVRSYRIVDGNITEEPVVLTGQ